jgi:hypothetical protein
MASKQQIILDVGINMLPDGSLTGDVAFEKVKEKVAAITPVPGGVGGVTTAVLMKHIWYWRQKPLPLLSLVLICKHHFQGIVLEEGVPVIKEQVPEMIRWL